MHNKREQNRTSMKLSDRPLQATELGENTTTSKPCSEICIRHSPDQADWPGASEDERTLPSAKGSIKSSISADDRSSHQVQQLIARRPAIRSLQAVFATSGLFRTDLNYAIGRSTYNCLIGPHVVGQDAAENIALK